MNIWTHFMVAIVLAFTSCQEDENSDQASTDGATVGAVGVSTSNVSLFSELSLSSAISFDVPDAFSAETTSLALAGDKRSREACELGQQVEEGIDLFESISAVLCHLEVESDQLQFGVKYNVVIQEDGQTEELGVFIDNAALDAEGNPVIKVQLCQANNDNEKVLSQVITVSAVNRDNLGSKGSIVARGTDSSGAFSVDGFFDVNVEEQGRSYFSTSMKFEADAGFNFRRKVVLDLIEDGVNSLSMTSTGAFGEQSFSRRGKALVNSEFGNTIFKSQVSGDLASWQGSNRAYFDMDGFVIAKDQTNAFDEGSQLFINLNEIPAILPEDFSPAAFDENAWDCQADETVTLDMAGSRGTQHAQCDSLDSQSSEESSCDSIEFEESSEVVEISDDAGEDIKDQGHITE